MAELRDYEVVIELRVVVVSVAGGEEEAKELAVNMALSGEHKHYYTTKITNISDLGTSEAAATRKDKK